MLKRHALMAMLLGLGLLVVSGAVGAQQKNTSGTARAMTLTPLDYIEIRQLVNRYGFAVDTGSNNGFDYADLFAADGEFMRPYAKGREQLAALARGRSLGPMNTVHYIMNHVIEPTPDGAVGKEYLIELNWDLTADQNGQRQSGGQSQGGQRQGEQRQGGQGRANQDQSQAQSGRGQGNGGRGAAVSGWDQIGRKAGELARTGGHYEDVYVKTPDGWRFKKRDFIPSKSGVDAAPLPAPRIPANAGQEVFPPAPPANFIPPTKQSTLTATDYLQIEQLVSSYGHALDSGFGKGENGEAYANLYTSDASFAGAVGHDKLVVLGKIQPRGPDYVRHYLTNHVIEPTPEGARGKEYLVVIDVGENGKPSSLFLGGHYEETYLKTAEGWRMKNRRLFPPRSGPQPADANPAAVALASLRTEQNLAKEGKASGLPAKDHVEIQQLVARYAYALDTAAEKGRAFSRLFTADGVLKTKTSQPLEIKGHEQLAAFAAGDLTHRGPFYVRDYVTNHLIHQSPEGATGRVYLVWIEVGENGNPGIVQAGGRYDDVYAKTPEGWRIKSRTFVPSKLGPRSQWEFVSPQ
jgi:SnoaL-like domain